MYDASHGADRATDDMAEHVGYLPRHHRNDDSSNIAYICIIKG